MAIGRRKILKVLSVLLCISYALAEKTVKCRKLVKTSRSSPKTCSVNESAVIDSEDYEISSKYSATVLSFNPNWYISYLPIKIKKIFPHLQNFTAAYCLIKNISEENFDGLDELHTLNLSKNRIQVLAEGIFKDLISLKSLDLNGNWISKISKEAFVGLPKSLIINLLTNHCINENLRSSVSAAAIAEIFCGPVAKKVTKKLDLKDDPTPKCSNKVSCNDTGFMLFGDINWQETCIINQTGSMDNEFKISSKMSNVTILLLFGDDINFLPIGLHQIFPVLLGIYAQSCSISTISNLNFWGLKELTHLVLSENNIEFIDSSTFKGLVALIELDLSSNAITSIAADAFADFPEKISIKLNLNICVCVDFIHEADATIAIQEDCSEKEKSFETKTKKTKNDDDD